MNHKKKEMKENKKHSFYSTSPEYKKIWMNFVCQRSYTILFVTVLAVKELALQGLNPEFKSVEKGCKVEYNCENKRES